MELLSLVKVGASQNILEIENVKLNDLFVKLQPATLSARKQENLQSSQRDLIRAQEIRTALGG